MIKKSPLAAILAASSLLSAHAADSFWNNAGTGSFLDPLNWTPAAPSTSDDAIFDNGGTATLGSLQVGAVSRLLLNNGTLSLNGGSISTVAFGTYESPGAYVIGSGTGTGTLTATGDSSLTGGRFRIGVDGGTGSVTLSGSSAYNGDLAQDTWVGAAGSTGSLTLNDTAQWNIANDWITVGNSGTGTLTMNGDSLMNVTGGNFVLSAGTGNGTFTQTGNSQLYVTGGDIRLGDGGTATVNLSGASKITNATGEIFFGNNGSTTVADISGTATVTAENNWIAIGRFGTSNGTLTIRDNARVEKIGGGGGTNIVIGAQTQGTVNVRDNGTLSSNTQIWVGEGGNANGTLNVEGGNVSTGGDFVAGQANGSNGTINASAGTITVGGWTKLGYQGGSTGEMKVSGTAAVNTTGSFVVGDSGTGKLTMQGGTINTAGQTWVGQGATAVGQFDMEGGNLTTAQSFVVGRSGAKGTFNMSGGTLAHTGVGQVNGANLDGSNIWINGTAEKVAVVNHTGGTINNTTSVLAIGVDAGNVSEWTASGGTANLGDTRPGFSGTGTLTIRNTANYTSTSVYLGSNASGVGTLNLEDGGTFAVNFIEEGAGNGFINADGGIIKAMLDGVELIRDFEAGDINIKEGGLGINTNGNNVSLSHALPGVGGIEKLGAGNLDITGSTTYEGTTSVEAGKLTISGSLTASGALEVAGGAALELTNSDSLFDSINVAFNGNSTVTLNFAGIETIGLLWIDGSYLAIGQYTLGQLQALNSTVTFLGDSNAILNVTAVPEPSTVALAISGLALIGLRLRQRSRAVCA